MSHPPASFGQLFLADFFEEIYGKFLMKIFETSIEQRLASSSSA
jgi:hypothetical protein